MWRLRIYQRIISKRFLHTNTKEKISKEHHDSFPPPNDPYWGQYYLQRAQQVKPYSIIFSKIQYLFFVDRWKMGKIYIRCFRTRNNHHVCIRG